MVPPFAGGGASGPASFGPPLELEPLVPDEPDEPLSSSSSSSPSSPTVPLEPDELVLPDDDDEFCSGVLGLAPRFELSDGAKRSPVFSAPLHATTTRSAAADPTRRRSFILIDK